MRTLNHVTTIIVAMLGLLAMTSLPSWAAPAPETSAKSRTKKLPEAFNPARCITGNKAYVYWAARDQVFRFKYDSTQPPIYPFVDTGSINLNLYKKEEIPTAPNPKEPEGCYGNPLRFVGVPYMSNFDQELLLKLTGRKLDTGTDGQHGYFAIRDDQRYSNMGSLLKKWFLESKNLWQRTSGIYESLRELGTDRNDYSINHYFKIDKALLSKHAQVNDLYVILKNDTASHVWNGQNGKAIEGGFDLFGNLRIATSFRLFPNEIDLLIPYYSGLINYVLQAHVPNYRWTPIKAK